MVSRARYYVDVNQNRPRSYWDYNNYNIEWGSCEDYTILKKIGRGKYSNVFLGVQLSTGKKICIKTLIPVRKKKIRREVKILKNLQGGPNIVKFFEPVRKDTNSTKSFIFEYVSNVSFKDLYPTFSDEDVRYYIYELLKALEWSHSCGIIHRDVKPQNVMIDHTRKKLALIDWGLAEFYHPEQQYNVRVSSRHFKGPELLVNYQVYDYSLDIWSLGCMLAGMVFGKAPFFHGRDNNDQLVKIVQVLGSESFNTYLQKYKIHLPPVLENNLSHVHFKKKAFESFINDDNQRFMSRELLEFLDSLLQYDHQRRPTTTECMVHAWFDSTRDHEQNVTHHYADRQTFMETEEDTLYKPIEVEKHNAICAEYRQQMDRHG